MLLCINLTIVGPFNLVRAAWQWFDAGARWSGYSIRNFAATIFAFHYLALACLCFAAGLYLWTLARRGVLLAKIFLIAHPSISVAILLSHFLLGFVVNERTVMSFAVQPTVFSVVWFWYLSVSKRVKATYPEL